MRVFLRVQSVKLRHPSQITLRRSRFAYLDPAGFGIGILSDPEFPISIETNGSTSPAGTRRFSRRPPGLLKPTLQLNAYPSVE
jgi:hypothetical protein